MRRFLKTPNICETKIYFPAQSPNTIIPIHTNCTQMSHLKQTEIS